MACICENRQHIFSVFKLFNSCDDTLQTLSVQVKDKRHSDWLNSIKSVPWCKISSCYIKVSIILTCATHLSVIIKHKNSKKLFNYEFSNFKLQSLDSIQTAFINCCKTHVKYKVSSCKLDTKKCHLKGTFCFTFHDFIGSPSSCSTSFRL